MQVYNMSSASIIGRSHLKGENGHCQDYATHIKRGDVYAIVLADGAGSYRFSKLGAKHISNYVLTYLSKHFDKLYDYERLPTLLTNKIEEFLHRIALIKNIDMNELSSTLLFVVIKDDRFLAGHIGDGVIGYKKKGELKVLSHPLNGDSANSTYFTTSISFENRLRIYKGNIKEIEAFLLMSDGLGDSLYIRRERILAKFADKIIDAANTNSKDKRDEILNYILAQLREKTMDDCSLAVIKKREDTLKPEDDKEVKSKLDIHQLPFVATAYSFYSPLKAISNYSVAEK